MTLNLLRKMSSQKEGGLGKCWQGWQGGEGGLGQCWQWWQRGEGGWGKCWRWLTKFLNGPLQQWRMNEWNKEGGTALPLFTWFVQQKMVPCNTKTVYVSINPKMYSIFLKVASKRLSKGLFFFFKLYAEQCLIKQILAKPKWEVSDFVTKKKRRKNHASTQPQQILG